ncbi:CT620/CT621 family type III secretion system effector [Chlamydiifrater phoenicopteri]|uniref:CT620/CT621 family type III secretion system effector n=1 Tax=Chlamydiifrater phoenicopteri TaxID=2681469 RepID=UPI001BCFB1D7|nr:CT620/CT621 family type III secretion system effector [Chlamydiifrater phoenicopteri]
MNFSNIKRSPTVSGSYIFNIQLDHKYSGFNPKSRLAINMEEVSSGIFGLKRIASIIEHLDAETVKNFYKKNKPIFKKDSFTTSSTQSSVPTPKTEEPETDDSLITQTQIAEIQAKYAPELLTLLKTNFPKFLEETKDLDLEHMPEIAAARIKIETLSSTKSWTKDLVQELLTLTSVPTEANMKDFFAEQKAEVIQQLQDELRKQLEEAGISEEEISKQLELYKDIFLEQYIHSHVSPALSTYRKNISDPLAKISKEIAEKTKEYTPPDVIDQNNLEEVNARILLNSIASALDTAIQNFPALATDPEIQTFQKELWNLQASSSLTEKYEEIYKLSNQPSEELLKQYLPPAAVTSYRNTISQTYQAMVLNISTAKSNVEDQIKLLESRVSIFQTTKSCFNSFISGLVDLVVNSNQTSRTIAYGMQAYSAFKNLSQIHPYLEEAEKKILDPFIKDDGWDANSANGKSGVLGFYLGSSSASQNWPPKTIQSMLSIMIIYQEMSDYLLHDAVLTSNIGALQETMKKKAQEVATLPYFKEINQQLTEITTTANYLQSMYQTTSEGFLQPKFNLLADYFTTIFSHHNANDELNKRLKQFNEESDTYLKKLQTEISDLQKKLAELTPDKAKFLEERCESIETTIESYGTNLGAAFWSMVMNSQLPRQKILLDPLVKEINFNNTASNSLNSLLQITSDFSTSAVYYNLSSYLIQSKEGEDLFAGNYYETVIARATERENISRDVARCKQALKLAEEVLSKIEKFPGVTEAQRDEMTATTAQYLFMLSTTITQLIFLDTLLTSLNITPELQKDDQNKQRDDLFKITASKDWMPSLASLEGFVTNGYNEVAITGGLGPIFTQIQSDQQNYTTQSQTQQLNLQNQMTGIQQEWTVVSSALQVWNAIITALCGQIYE